MYIGKTTYVVKDNQIISTLMITYSLILFYCRSKAIKLINYSCCERKGRTYTYIQTALFPALIFLNNTN